MRGCGRSSLCARQSRLGERGSQKIVLQRQRADFGVQRLHVDQRLCRLCFHLPKNPGSSFKQLILPLTDLVGIHVELLGQFRQRLFAPDSGNSQSARESIVLTAGRAPRYGCRHGAGPWVGQPVQQIESGGRSVFDQLSDAELDAVALESAHKLIADRSRLN